MGAQRSCCCYAYLYKIDWLDCPPCCWLWCCWENMAFRGPEALRLKLPAGGTGHLPAALKGVYRASPLLWRKAVFLAPCAALRYFPTN
eukprot:scaffold26917_cov17-Tisochrysis_lutea.AAC.2